MRPGPEPIGGERCDFFDIEKPSLKTLFGVTKAKKRLKKELGITTTMKPLRWWTNQKRKAKRRAGYESKVGRALRHGLRTPGGCLVSFVLLGIGWLLLSLAS